MREKCSYCGDKIFKLVDGKILCRRGHEYGDALKKGETKATEATK